MRKRAQLPQYQSKRKKVTLDGSTLQARHARRRIIRKVCNAQGKLSGLTENEQKYILGDENADSTQTIRDALNNNQTSLSNEQLKQLSQHKPKIVMVTIDGRTQQAGHAIVSIIRKVRNAQGKLSGLTDDEKKFILDDKADSTKLIRETLNGKQTQLSTGQLEQLSQHIPKEKLVTIDGSKRLPNAARVSIITKVCDMQGKLSDLTEGEQKFILGDKADSTQTIRDALNDNQILLSDEQLEQLSQYKLKRKKVTIGGRTQVAAHVRGSIITKVRNAKVKLSGLTEDEKKFILDDENATSTKPIRKALKDQKTKLTQTQLKQLSQHKRKIAMVTIDGHTQQAGAARGSIIRKVLDAQGKLSGLTEDEQKFILDDKADSTKPIRKALKDQKTKLTQTQLKQLSQHKPKIKMVTIDGHKRLASNTRMSIITKGYLLSL